VGDAEWRSILARHDERARAEIERHRGRYVDSAGDGLLATFDGPARAVRCAQAIAASVRDLVMAPTSHGREPPGNRGRFSVECVVSL
jgi:class 3 adenylate cyclase